LNSNTVMRQVFVSCDIVRQILCQILYIYLTNSSWYLGPYGSLWTGMSPTKYHMDRSEARFFFDSWLVFFCHIVLRNSFISIDFYVKYGRLYSYCSWIYNYLCNQCLSPLTVCVRISLMARFTRYNIK